ncbi:MAG: hypothetical protein SV186_01155 [Candidatus Nanohaloarchaea archaeon]|nr:hypothetical protein [Candidatus Nanohaloarchaea archaeon]
MTDDSCLLATHIDPAWRTPAGYQADLQKYVAEHDHDSFVYVSNQQWNDGDWAYKADEVIASEGGRLPDDERDRLLDEHTSFDHIGAYHEQCHAATWEDLVQGIYDQARGATYEVTFPAELVTGSDERLADTMTTEQPGSNPLFTERELDAAEASAAMVEYEAIAAFNAENDGTFSYDVDPDDLSITWTLHG